MDAIGKRQPVPHRLKCKYRLRSVGFSQGFSLPFLKKGHTHMGFFTTAITTLKTLVCAIGAGLAAWGVINLLEGYGNDNPGAKSQGIKQLMAGGGIVLIGMNLIPQLATLFG